jgi:hypothetical protein
MNPTQNQACLRRFSCVERNGSGSNQRAGKGRERLRSEEWNAAETPESGNPRRLQIRLNLKFDNQE